MPIEALEGISDRELFDEANADEAPADDAVVETPEAEPEQQEQPRDEQGKFAAKAPEEPEKPVIETAAEKPAVDDNAPQVPSWRVREINEEKRQIAERLAAKEAAEASWQAERQQMLTRLAALEKPAEPEKVTKPDPLLDPEGYEAYLERKVEDKLLNQSREASLQLAHRTYKTEFEEAYAAAQKQVDPALKARMQNSRDPGETLIEWHREQKTRAEVGTDLNAFRQREQERLLSDPAFLAKAVEKARGSAQQQLQPGKAPPVDLPPSLARATNASTITSADDNDVSDEGLWRHANA